MFGGRIGLPEILILLVIALLIFGPGRIGKIASELGQGIRNFRDGVSGKDESGNADGEKKEDSK